MSTEPVENKLTPTHYFMKNDNGTFKIDAFDTENIPEGDQIQFIHVVSTNPENPLITLVDKDGNVLAEEIMPEGLQDAVKAMLNPTTGGRRRRSRRQSKRRSKRQNGGRRKRDSKRRQRR